jgi:hypothetical protein
MAHAAKARWWSLLNCEPGLAVGRGTPRWTGGVDAIQTRIGTLPFHTDGTGTLNAIRKAGHKAHDIAELLPGPMAGYIDLQRPHRHPSSPQKGAGPKPPRQTLILKSNFFRQRFVGKSTPPGQEIVPGGGLWIRSPWTFKEGASSVGPRGTGGRWSRLQL